MQGLHCWALPTEELPRRNELTKGSLKLFTVALKEELNTFPNSPTRTGNVAPAPVAGSGTPVELR